MLLSILHIQDFLEYRAKVDDDDELDYDNFINNMIIIRLMKNNDGTSFSLKRELSIQKIHK